MNVSYTNIAKGFKVNFSLPLGGGQYGAAFGSLLPFPTGFAFALFNFFLQSKLKF